MGLGVSNTNIDLLETKLKEFREENPEWEELKQFYFVRSRGELQIWRARNTLPARSDGDFRPLED